MQQTSEVLGDRYELGPVLGRGGMARVYRATDRTLDRPVAVKVLAEPYDRDRAFVARFRREAHAAARLNHPNIVSVYDSGSDDGTHFIVMELVEGRTLSDRVEHEGPVPPKDVAVIGADVARALAAAHERGVIHRDVKPGNVLLSDDGGVKVVDFGIARASGAEDITRSGLILGSASYLSPEQAQGASGDERSDQYGLGCVLYQMLTGRPPFVADDPIAALYRHVNEEPAPPSSIRPVSEDLERVVLRCLEKDPARRFASAGELETALLAASGDEPTTTMPLQPVAAEPTAPIARGGAEPTAPVVRGAPEATAPVAGRSPVTHRLRPSSRDRRIGAVVAGLLLIVGAGLLLADPLRFPSRAELREARREATAAAGTEGVASDSPSLAPSPTVPAPPDVGEAHAALHGAILSARTAGSVEPEDADKLRDRAHAVLERYEESDAEGVAKEIDGFAEELAKLVEEEKVSVQAAVTIDSALDDLVLAISSALPFTGAEEAGGPPPWAEGQGNDEDDD